MNALQMYIGGRWVASVSGATYQARSPATGEAIATLPEGTREDAQRAIAAADEGKARLARMSVWDRARVCARVADVLERRQDELARTLTLDQGKPLHSEAKAEVSATITGWRNAADHIKWLETSVIPVEDPHERVVTIRQPRGVYAVITPWNFPLNIPTEYLAPGLASGNAMVWVPAPTTSVVAVKLMECLEEAEVPAGAINLVTGPGPVVGDEIVAHAGTDAVAFTGSSATGEHIARRAAGKPLLLELGGNGPTVILDDADLELASGARIDREETFGPVAPLVPFQSDEVALAWANDNTLGLVSAVFTSDLSRAFWFAERLRTGIVNVNDSTNYWELHIPFGGVAGKRSGIGRLGGKHTLYEMTDLRTICLDVRRPQTQ